ncbi:MAG TPA: MFS transporter [Clostridiales bacterium]|jgi:MFS family permease|nr:MFS transporter [Clostridiales bacterium]
MGESNNTKLTPKVWTAFVLFGLIGQIAWIIENMYLNVFVYKTVTYDPDAIAIMVAASAIIATAATLLMGALSDKIGKRKIFMTWGYIVWGLSIVSFGFLTVKNMSALFSAANAVTITVFAIVAVDCVMTYIGSTANDAAFNAWVTDITSPSNRGKVEGLLATMPLLAMLVVFGFLDSLTQNSKWIQFFAIVGGVVALSGLAGMFIIKDKAIPKKDSKYFKDIIYGFRPSVIRDNKLLYLMFITVCALGIAQQVFMPYFIIYFEFFLGITDYALILGAVLIMASVLSVILGRVVDKYGKSKFLLMAGIIYIIGMLGLYIFGKTLKDNRTLTTIFTTIMGILTMGAYLLAMIVLNSSTRDLLPKGHVGHFTGIRMIFFVMVPMVIGPFIGSTIIKNSPMTYVDEFGAIQSTPIPEIFLGGAIVAVLALIPIVLILRAYKKYGEILKPQSEKNE